MIFLDCLTQGGVHLLPKKKAVPCTLSQMMIGLSLVLAVCVDQSESRCLRNRSKENLCGSELVDILQFICEHTGFYFSKTAPIRSKNRPGIVDECCFCSCTVAVLESYCAAPVNHSTNVEEKTQ